MHLLIEVVANELSHTKESLLLYIENFIVHEYIWVFVETEGVFNAVHVGFELSKPIIFNFREVQLAKHGSLIFQSCDEGIENLSVAYIIDI